MVNVELKNLPTDPAFDPGEQLSADLVAVLAAGATPWPAHVVVSSFWPAALQAVRAAERARSATAEVALALLVHPALDASASLEGAARLGCAALHPHHSQVTAALVGRAHDLAMTVTAWTVNLPGELEAVLGAGVDGVITDRVAPTLAALGRA